MATISQVPRNLTIGYAQIVQMVSARHRRVYQPRVEQVRLPVTVPRRYRVTTMSTSVAVFVLYAQVARWGMAHPRSARVTQESTRSIPLIRVNTSLMARGRVKRARQVPWGGSQILSPPQKMARGQRLHGIQRATVANARMIIMPETTEGSGRATPAWEVN